MASAVQPSRSTPSRRLPLIAAAGVAVVGIAVLLAVVLSGTGGRTVLAGSHDDRTLVGSAARPALALEGQHVRIDLPQGSVLATVTGPDVPGEGLPYQADATMCTWTLTFTDATTAVPLSLADFDTLDHGGRTYHPQVVPGTTAPPKVLQPGHTATFQLRADMVVGEGLMRYAPDGDHIAAKWDFEVEND